MQLTSPVPDASDCSASNPSAIWPVAATAVPPPPGAVTVATAPGADTVTGCVPFVLRPAAGAGGLAAAGAARTALNVAAPVGTAAGLAAAEPAADTGRRCLRRQRDHRDPRRGRARRGRRAGPGDRRHRGPLAALHGAPAGPGPRGPRDHEHDGEREQHRAGQGEATHQDSPSPVERLPEPRQRLGLPCLAARCECRSGFAGRSGWPAARRSARHRPGRWLRAQALAPPGQCRGCPGWHPSPGPCPSHPTPTAPSLPAASRRLRPVGCARWPGRLRPRPGDRLPPGARCGLRPRPGDRQPSGAPCGLRPRPGD